MGIKIVPSPGSPCEDKITHIVLKRGPGTVITEPMIVPGNNDGISNQCWDKCFLGNVPTMANMFRLAWPSQMFGNKVAHPGKPMSPHIWAVGHPNCTPRRTAESCVKSCLQGSPRTLTVLLWPTIVLGSEGFRSLTVLWERHPQAGLGSPGREGTERQPGLLRGAQQCFMGRAALGVGLHRAEGDVMAHLLSLAQEDSSGACC